ALPAADELDDGEPTTDLLAVVLLGAVFVAVATAGRDAPLSDAPAPAAGLPGGRAGFTGARALPADLPTPLPPPPPPPPPSRGAAGAGGRRSRRAASRRRRTVGACPLGHDNPPNENDRRGLRRALVTGKNTEPIVVRQTCHTI